MITIGYTTSRWEPHFDWFVDSCPCAGHDGFEIIPIGLYDGTGGKGLISPKPTVWQGNHRRTRHDWWAVSNARNSVIALARGDYVVFVDDRCVLSDTWLDSIKRAAAEEYAVCGAYEKRHGLSVSNGKITNPGHLDSRDHRLKSGGGKMIPIAGSWFFGGTLGMPLEWALAVNGFDERLDGASAEDTMCGIHLKNNGYPIWYDPELFITEDRTPGECGPDMRRSSKERHPNDTTDKLHTALRTIAKEKRANHHCDLRQLREHMKAHDEWPVGNLPTHDYFDGQEIGPEFDDCYEGKKEWPKR